MNVSAKSYSFRPYLWGGAALVFSASATYAADSVKSPSEVVFLVEIVVLIMVGRLLGEAMHRIRQPSIMGS